MSCYHRPTGFGPCPACHCTRIAEAHECPTGPLAPDAGYLAPSERVERLRVVIRAERERGREPKGLVGELRAAETPAVGRTP